MFKINQYFEKVSVCMQKTVDAKLLEFIRTDGDNQCVVLDNYAQDLFANEFVIIAYYIE